MASCLPSSGTHDPPRIVTMSIISPCHASPPQSLIELLGQEPDANRSSTRLLEEIGVRFMDPEQAMERGKKLEDKGSDDAALRLYVKLLEHHPDFTPAMDAAAEVRCRLYCALQYV